MVNFFLMITTTPVAERVSEFEKLKGKLIETSNSSASDDFDYISWIDSKIKKRPFLDILKEKNKSK